jgi:ubiquitin C-terminal hydrolase
MRDAFGRPIPSTEFQLWKLMRTHCTDCGSSEVVNESFGSVALDLDAEGRAIAEEALDEFGPDADAWRCTRCGAFGIFSDWH